MTEMTGAAPLRLNKITTRYHRGEDRIRIDAQLEDGSTQVLWLTQRLCGQLVGALVDYFNRSALAVGDASPRNQREVQKYLHQSARSVRRKTTPVSPGKTRQASLLNQVRVRTGANAVQLILPLPGGKSGIILFSPNEARQWLDILYHQYRGADWPLTIWPEWIGKGGDIPPEGSSERKGSVH